MTLFRAVAHRSAEEREDFYATNQVSDQLKLEVESLLEAGNRTVESFAGHLASAAVRALLEDPLPTPPEAPSPRPLLQPVSIGRYEVKRLLGRGGMSEVYLARDPMLERDIAVKLIGGELDSDVARRRLVREASAAGRLRHPNIVTIFDAGEHGGQPYIAMEYVPGETLRALIKRRDPLPLRRRLELIEGACAGLAHAHRAGVVHLDIKPDNLIVDETGVVKVLDFGIARVLSSEAVATRHIVGTLRYMSPEQIAGDPVDHRSDIFSLGCSLYEMLAYLPAYSGSTREIVYRIAVGPVPRLAEVAPDTDPRLDAAIGRAMSLEREDRFADLDEFRNELARLRDVLDPAGERPVQAVDERLAEQVHATAMQSTARRALEASSRQQQTVPPPPRWRVAAIAAAAVVGVSAVAFLALWNREPATAPQPQTVSVPAPQGAPTQPAAVPAPGPAPAPAGESATGQQAVETDVWRRFGVGDREGVMKLLRSPSGGGVSGRLPYEVLTLVKQSVSQGRRTADNTPGARSLEQYRVAEDFTARAARLEQARDPFGALVALWQASDMYARAVNNARGGSTPPVTAPDQRAAAEPPVQPPQPSPVPLPGPAAQQSESPRPPAPVAPVPAPAPAPATVVDRGPADEAARAAADTQAVLVALERYRAAYRAKNVDQLQAVYPGLSGAEISKIGATFQIVREYDIDIRDTQVQFQGGDAASADAVMSHRMTLTNGQTQSPAPVSARFQLRRNGGQWIITDLVTRGR